MSLLSAHEISRVYSRVSLVGASKPRPTLDAVSIDIGAGETIVLLGRSGCRKSTLARILAGLEKPDGSEIRFHGRPLEALPKPERALFQRSVQMVFQDSFGAADPRCAIGEIIAEPLRHLLGLDRQACRRRTGDVLMKVWLEPGDAACHTRRGQFPNWICIFKSSCSTFSTRYAAIWMSPISLSRMICASSSVSARAS